MKNQSTFAISLYYLSGIVVLSLFLVRAVVVGGSHVGYGREVSTRQAELRLLTDQQTTLERQLAQAQSLTEINQTLAEANFVKIDQPTLVRVPSSLALAQ